MSEQPARADVERVENVAEIGREPVEGVARRVLGTLALAVAAEVERDDTVVPRQIVHLVGEVLLRAAEPVDEDERGTAPLLDHFQRHAVVGHDAHVGPPSLRSRPGGREASP